MDFGQPSLEVSSARAGNDLLGDDRPNGSDEVPSDQPIARLGEGEAFGEMALLSGSPRTATAGAGSDVELLEIDRQDFERLIAGDQVLARAVERLSHDRHSTI